MTQERIQKLISQSGLLSRRAAEKAITEGRVQLNGKKVTELGTKADLNHDVLSLDGIELKKPEHPIVILLHKPKGYVTTRQDPEGRKTVFDLLPTQMRDLGLHTIGRLDLQSTGLLLFTNDGQLTYRLTHPSFQIQKIYEVKVHGCPTSHQLQELTQGISLEDGLGRFETVVVKEKSTTKTILEVTVTEGRNRFVRRMLAAVNLPVDRLKRTQMGPFDLENLSSGDFTVVQSRELDQKIKKLGF